MSSVAGPTIVREGPRAPGVSRLGLGARLGRRLIRSVLPRIERGRVTLRDGAESLEFGDPATGPDAELTVHDRAFYAAAAFGGSVGVAESFMDGHWTSPNPAALIEVLASNEEAMRSVESPLARLAAPVTRLAYALQRNSRAGSRRNIVAHYDLSNEFFALFLDPSMTYSGAVFDPPGVSLEDAQTEKIDRACRKLDLKPTDHLLEIGTGWGSAAIHAARVFGCRVTTTTISDRQHDLAADRIREAGLEDRITLLKRDYRDLEGRYDKILSVEMIEAVGRQYLDTFFEKIGSLLAPDGLAMLQAITIANQHFERAARRRDFLKKYIFPGSCLLGMEAMASCVRRKTSLRILDSEDIGPHYADTLLAWRERFDARIDDVRALGFDERFERMWRFYLCYCEGTFRSRRCSAVQLLLAGPGNRRAPISALRRAEAISP